MQKKFINLNEILQIHSFYQSLVKWIQNFHKFKNADNLNNEEIQKINQQAIKLNLNKYSRTLKPVIYKFSQLTQNLNSQKYGFYTQLINQKQLNQVILRLFEPLNKFQILTQQIIIANPNFQKVQSLDGILQENKFQIYKMNLNQPPKNKQIKWWNHTIPIEYFSIQGIVSQGKGIGKQQLGMPTANIKISKQLNNSLGKYPNGIYITYVTIKELNQKYLGASSLGTNPHYENNQFERILQVYILNDFGQRNIYGKQIKVQFIELIRFELKFNSFNAFLNGMRNDIQICSRFNLEDKCISK